MIPLAIHSGLIVDVEDLRPADIDVETIAHALALEPRFGGHTRLPYSVALHSVYVSYLVPPEHAFVGLLHDAPEAFGLRDLPSPIKRTLPAYRALERRVWNRIALRFGLAAELPDEVHRADLRMLLTEARDLHPLGLELFVATFFNDDERAQLPKPYPGPVVTVPWRMAKRLFLSRFAELTGGRPDPDVPPLRLVTEERVR